jgi:hypothetical protein
MKPVFTIIILAALLWGCHSNKTSQNEYQADVIIYGGTSGAVIAAVEVAQSGKSVIMVSPDKHLGGLTSGGLGFTDTGNKSVIGGLSQRFVGMELAKTFRIWKQRTGNCCNGRRKPNHVDF